MINYFVDNMIVLIEKLKEEGIEIIGKIEECIPLISNRFIKLSYLIITTFFILLIPHAFSFRKYTPALS